MDNLNFFYGRWSYKLAVFPICNLLELGETCGFQIQKAWPRSERFPQLSPRIYLVFFSCVGVFTVWTAHAACCQLPHQQVQLMNQHLTLFFLRFCCWTFLQGPSMTPRCNFSSALPRSHHWITGASYRCLGTVARSTWLRTPSNKWAGETFHNKAQPGRVYFIFTLMQSLNPPCHFPPTNIFSPSKVCVSFCVRRDIL